MKTLDKPGDRAELLGRVRLLRPECAARWGRMSAHQMVCHACDAFRMATGEKAVSPSGSLLQRTALKWIALYVPLAWPAGVPTSPEIDQHLTGTKPAVFAADVAELEALLQAVATQPASFAWPSHPIFGRMSRTDWLRWGYLHVDHHLRQFGA
jgi:Protein of unknown function (DUF1569)